MKKILSLLLLAVAIPFAMMAQSENLTVNGTSRHIITYAPKELGTQRPLLIACHGYNQSADYLKGFAKFETLADTAKFVVVYADGLNKAWDISGTSDLKFMETIIETMYSRYQISKKKVYLTGFSMGGMFTYYAANKMADKIAAFAPVSGYPMGGPNASASRPVPILHTHGTSDEVCGFSSVQSHINAWVKFNGCNTTPEVIQPYPKSKPSSTASLTRYRHGKNGVEVALLTLPGKGHWWSMDEALALTSVEVWNFCKRFAIGADEPEVKSIVPEEGSFDLVPSVNNTFQVTFNVPIDCAKVQAVFQPATGSPVNLEVKSEGFASTVTFELPTDAEVADGEGTLAIRKATTKAGGVLAEKTFTYVYGVEEVGETLNVDTLYRSKWFDERDAIGEGIPSGWRRITTFSDGSRKVVAAGTKDCGEVRMKYFTHDGDFDAGFYLSARDHSNCNLAYGVYNNALLPLKVGRYTIRFRSIYWSEGAMNAKATFGFSLKTSTNQGVFSAPSLTSTGTMKEKDGQKVSGSKEHVFQVDITKATNYVLNFDMAEGWNSVIFGDVMVTTTPTQADLYKGTFLRAMTKAQKWLEEDGGSSADTPLAKAVQKYADFASTSPTAYTAATRELTSAMDKYEVTGIDAVSADNRSASSEIYSLTGVRMGKDKTALPCGIYVMNGKKFIKR